jgi:hypothetical protein
MRHTGNKNRPLLLVAAFLLSAGTAAFSVYGLSGSGLFEGRITAPETVSMIAELLLLFLCLMGCGILIGKKTVRNICCLFAVCVYLWAHRIFMPVILSGLYAGSLVLTGEVLLIPQRKKEGGKASWGYRRVAHDFMTGCASYMIFICLLSLFGLGSVRLVRMVTACLSVGMLFLFLLLDRSRLMPLLFVPLPPDGKKEKEEETKTGKVILFSAVAVLVLLQAGRMNIAADYDSLHYGLRTPYIFNNGRGIFENLGLVNDVYYYPKGLEILTMPLSGTFTYGFVLAFSFWTAIFSLAAIYRIACSAAGKSAGYTAVFFSACMPGIMNMSVSAKPDIGAFLFQLIFINEIVSFIKDEQRNRSYFFWGAAAVILSFTMKPTALVFSPVLVLAAVIFLKVRRIKSTEKIPGKARILILPGLAFLGVTARTILMTGYPFSSVFTSVWEALGMKGKFPVASHAIPNAAAGFSISAGLIRWLRRILAFFLIPSGDENRHILIAWGTVLFPLLLIFILAERTAGRKSRRDHPETAAGADFLSFLLMLLLLIDLITVAMLWQVDGNYYMLTYAVAAVTAAVCFSEEENGERNLRIAVMPAVLFAAAVTCVTNWAGAKGLTGTSFMHYGFYDHRSDVREEMTEKGCSEIYQFLYGRPRARLLTFSEEPGCYDFPCCAGSYTDIEGSGGNVRLVKTLDIFEQYLDHAEIGYIYTDENFLAKHERAAELIRYMKEDGSILEIIGREGNILYEYKNGNR